MTVNILKELDRQLIPITWSNFKQFKQFKHSVHVRYMSSSVRLLSVCNVCAPYSNSNDWYFL